MEQRNMDCLVSPPLVSVPVSFLGRFGGVCQPKNPQLAL